MASAATNNDASSFYEASSLCCGLFYTGRSTEAFLLVQQQPFCKSLGRKGVWFFFFNYPETFVSREDF